MPLSIGRSLCLLLALTGAASAFATPADDTKAVDFAIAMRAGLVERANALQQMLPHDLRTRVLLSLSPFVTDADRKLVREDDRELVTLVELARGSTDPIVLSRLAQRCRGAGKVCDALQMAQRWVDVDTQNQAAWLALGDVQWRRKDEAAAKATFVRAAQTSSWRDGLAETGRFLLRSLPKDLSAAGRAEALLTVTGIQGMTPNAFTFVSAECQDAALIAACHRILATMYEGAESLVPIATVARLSARYGVEPTTVAGRDRTYDAMTVGLRIVRPPDIDGEGTAETDYAAFDRIFEARLEHGERAQARADLVAAGLTEEQAAERGRRERVARETRRAASMRRAAESPSIR